VIRGSRAAATAEQLMRSRYSAYALGEIQWIVDSQVEEARRFTDLDATAEWSKRSTWKGLEIIAVDQGAADDHEGAVEFKAYYDLAGESITHHEIASFKKVDGKWQFVDGLEVKPRPFKRTAPKVGANDPCSCGSGKKYKKCCGKVA
jgi:SEC-C motif-containing protein